MSMEKKLTNKQAMFVDEYVVDFNGAQAAIRAGYSKKTARQAAAENLTKPDVKHAIDQKLETRKVKTELSAAVVIDRLNRIALFAEDAGDINSAIKANELIGKHFKAFTDKVETSGNMNITVLTGLPLNDN